MKLMQKIDRMIADNEFSPGRWGGVLNPFYFARKGLAKQIQAMAADLHGCIIDIGCGNKPYESFFSCEKYVGLEIDTPHSREHSKADFFYDGERFPFESSEFDCAVANQVFEHVFNPDQFLDEINRVLKTDGKLLLTVPFAWDEHEQPYDYARYSSFGISHLLEQHGFIILKQEKSGTGMKCLFQLIGAYFYKITRSRHWRLTLIATILFSTFFNVCGIVMDFLFPDNQDLYLDNIILAQKKR